MRLNQPRFRGFGDGRGVGVTLGTGVVCRSSGGGVGTNSWADASPATRQATTNIFRVRLMRGLNSKRCKSCQTLYQIAMRSFIAIGLSLLLTAHTEAAKDRHALLRLHME